MSENNSGGVLVMVLVVWIVVVLVYATTWAPSTVRPSPLAATERAFILKLSPDGPLARMLDRGSLATLAINAEAAPATATPVPAVTPPTSTTAQTAGSAPAVAAPPDQPLPPKIQRIENARVIEKTCAPSSEPVDKQSCYAVFAVPQESIEPLMRSPGKVWVWLQANPQP